MRYNIWVLEYIVAYEYVAYEYVVQFEPYQGVKKRKQVASSSTWGLEENVLRLIECLPHTFSYHIFMNTNFTSFCLFSHL